ncbi:hypothetical protein [Capnocytophaga canis]|uniref:hypothetical protein n=1 Tax=Capnocytophaga canis TaxID=1848903 RepID=UPI0037D24557
MEKQVMNKLEVFLTNNIDNKSLAQSIRRFMHESIKMVINAEGENAEILNKQWVSEGHYFLTELCEILDPQLNNEE